MDSQNVLVDESRPDDAAVRPSLRMTEEEFAAWCDEDTRAEWVDGEVVLMSPVYDEHADVTLSLGAILKIFVEHHKLGLVRQDVQIRLRRRRRSPDTWFLAEARRDLFHKTYVDGPPDLVVEVVSPDSQSRDWREKYLEYQEAGVREYWVVDPMSEHAEVYVLEESATGGAYRRVEEKDGVLRSTVVPGFFVRTEWLWRRDILVMLKELGLV